jgi:SAM-dependent methyltransferase
VSRESPQERFAAVLRPPPERDGLPEFDDGWRQNGECEPFLAYRAAIEVNWSADLEALHEKSSRDHFLDVATRRALVEAVAGTVQEGTLIADLGCSTGHLLADLRNEFPATFLVGLDLVEEGLRKAHRRVPGAALLLADVTDLPLADGSVSAVVSANVLEHVPDDVEALAEVRRVLAPGGRAAFVVPAGPGLYDYYDSFLRHARRYRRGELARKGRQVGLDVVEERFIGSFIHPAFWIVKKTNRVRYRRASSAQVERLVRRDIARTGNSRVAALATRLENYANRRGMRLPFGIRNLTVLGKSHNA